MDIDRLSIRRGLILALDSAERSNNAHQPAPNKTYPILPAPASAMALEQEISVEIDVLAQDLYGSVQIPDAGRAAGKSERL